MGRLKAAKRGQATVVGAIFFFMIAVIMINFLYEVYMVQSEMNQFDAERAQERVEITAVLFGDKNTYPSPNTTTILNGEGTSPITPPHLNSTRTTAGFYPIPNMNLTTNMEGWTFTRRYVDPNITGTTSYVTDRGAGGGFDGTITGSISGPGVIFSDFEFNPPKNTVTGALMNWTTRFHVDLDETGPVIGASLTWARWCVKLGPKVLKWPTLKVFLKEPGGAEHQVEAVTVQEVEDSWNYSTKTLDPAWFASSGWYSLAIQLYDVQSYEPRPNKDIGIRELFDDIGITLLSEAYVTDWYASFLIDEAPGLIKQMELTYTGHYNSSVTQYISIMDFTSSKWVQLDKSFVSTQTSTRDFALTGPDIQKYISETMGIQLRVYTADNNPFKCVADDLQFSDYYHGGSTKIAITFKNSGGVTTHLISLWVIDSEGHHQFNLDLNLSPGETRTHVIQHPWTSGEYTFKAGTDKGTITLYVSTV